MAGGLECLPLDEKKIQMTIRYTPRRNRQDNLVRVAVGWSALAVLGILASGCVGSGQPTRVAAADEMQGTADSRAPEYQLASASGKYLAGRFARRSRDYGNAADLLSDALNLDSKNRRIRRAAFYSLVASGKIDSAKKLAGEIVTDDSAEPIANLVLALQELRAGNRDAAAKRISDMPRRGMNSFTSPLLLAWIRFAEGKTDEAVTALDGLAKVASFSALRNLHVGLIQDLAGNAPAAEEALRNAQKGAESLRPVQAYGYFLERAGRRDEALAIYRSFRSKNDESDAYESLYNHVQADAKPERLVNDANEGLAEVFFNLAGTLAQGRSTDLALIYGRLALDLRPDFPLAQVLLGGLLESLDRKEEALALYNAVSPASPLSWSARLRRAAALDDLKRTDEAIAELGKMSAERKDRSEPLVRLGDLLRSKEKFGESADAYSSAIQRIGDLAAKDWSLLYARGIAYERSSQWPKAEKDFLRALDLSPDQPFVLNYLGYSWVDQGLHLDRARKMIEKAVELRPNDGYIVDSLGWVLYRLGDFEGAASNLERAVLLRPDDPTINDHLGDAYWRVGRLLEARFQWRRALSLDPDKKEIPAIENKLRRGLADAPTKEKRG